MKSRKWNSSKSLIKKEVVKASLECKIIVSYVRNAQEKLLYFDRKT